MNTTAILSKLSLVFISVGLVACANYGMGLRHDTAQRLAAPAFMVKKEIPAAPFLLTAYERVNDPQKPVHVYIEGDGLAWISKKQKSMNPTPKNPVALHLAAFDNAKNVIWIARPCQYSDLLDENTPCDSAYWGSRRYAPEVISSFNSALDNIKGRYGVREFHLIGFSGGGTVAALLAAEREDILSLRTVAGNLDHRAHSAFHNVSVLENSLNPADYAQALSKVPQVHFIGGQDEVVPPKILHSYMQALGDTSCVHYEFIQEASHMKGWGNKWPELLKIEATCNNTSLLPSPVIGGGLPFDMDDSEIIYSEPMTPKK